jgi:hypothetical protein
MTTSVRRSATIGAVVWLAMAVAATVAAQQPPQPALERGSRVLACSPQASILPPAPSLHVLGGQEDRKALFGTGENVILGSGTVQGLRVGQEYFVRRVVQDRFAMPVVGYVPVSIHTAARLRVVEVQGGTAVATITDACDGVVSGDYLEPYVPAVVPVPAALAQPDYESAGVIVLGDERRQLGSAGSTMIVDRGTYHGVRPGQRATIFRAALGGTGPVVRIGEATAMIVDRDTSVVLIDSSRDAVMVGDRVALHK